MIKKIIKMLKKEAGITLAGAVLYGTSISGASYIENNTNYNLHKQEYNVPEVKQFIKNRIEIENTKKVNTEIKQNILEEKVIPTTYVAKKDDKMFKSDYMTEKEILENIDPIYKKVKLPSYINKDYLKRLIFAESSNNPEAISDKGARGLCQLTEDTWDDYETIIPYKEGAFNPRKNIEVMAKHLQWQDNYFKTRYSEWEYLSNQEKLDFHSAAYNYGMSNFRAKAGWNIKATPWETREHVRKINEEYQRLALK